MPDLTPSEVIRKAMLGDTGAFRALVEQNQGFAYAVAFRFVQNEQEAEDIVQEAFVRLWKNLSSYRDEVKLTTWLYRIVANLCLDFLKSRRGKEKVNVTDISQQISLQSGITPEDAVYQQELMNAIYAVANELTPKQKAVFILRDLEGLTTEEVKQILSMSAGNIKSNLFHARQKVGERLKAFYQVSHQSSIS